MLRRIDSTESSRVTAAELRDSQAFESLLGEISSRLLAVPLEGVDDEIRRSLEKLIRFFGADRGAIGRVAPDGTVVATHSWEKEGIIPSPTGALTALPNYSEVIRRGQPFLARTLDEVPQEWQPELEYARRVGMKSQITFPLRAGNQVIGAIAMASMAAERDWSVTLGPRLRLLGEILANALLRREQEAALQKSLREIEKLNERLEAETDYLREEMRGVHGFDEIVGESESLRRVLRLVEQVAPTDVSVLLSGETGTGKELVARAIHACSPRTARPLVVVNCAALPGTLIESELFGYERGAFTGALQTRPGRFEVADGGTLFLDEIGDLSLELQIKLLRVLQEKTLERLGSSKTRPVDVRVIAATHHNLDEAVRAGRFRADLYYRLKVFPIVVPPLRERREDIPALVWYFIHRRQASLHRSITRVPERTMQRLKTYDWPGNVRELQHVVERALILSHDGSLRIDESPQAEGVRGGNGKGNGSDTLADVERAHVLRILEDCDWKVAGAGGAAERLGLNRSTLRARMAKLRIERP
jgi:formate hydrogenlyase transcriptional activator